MLRRAILVKLFKRLNRIEQKKIITFTFYTKKYRRLKKKGAVTAYDTTRLNAAQVKLQKQAIKRSTSSNTFEKWYRVSLHQNLSLCEDQVQKTRRKLTRVKKRLTGQTFVQLEPPRTNAYLEATGSAPCLTKDINIFLPQNDLFDIKAKERGSAYQR